MEIIAECTETDSKVELDKDEFGTPRRMESTRLSPRKSGVHSPVLPPEDAAQQTINIPPSNDQSNNEGTDDTPAFELQLETSELQNNSAIVHEREIFKKEFNGLNNRLIAYVQKVKTNERQLEQAERVKRDLEQQLAADRDEAAQQIGMLRNELEERIRQAVEAEEENGRIRSHLEESDRERSLIKSSLAEKKKREESLERDLVAEKAAIRTLREEVGKLREKRVKEDKEREQMSSLLTQLKVENATLKERVKIASFELTMQETKVFEAAKRLQFSAEDVEKKLAEERSRLQNLGLEKLEEVRNKHQKEIERLKKEFSKKMQDTLLTYVSAEEHARLDTRLQEALKRAETAEKEVAMRDEDLEKVKNGFVEMKLALEKELATERRQQEKLKRKIAVQKKSYEDIHAEVDTYRKLIESLDIDGDVLANTPIGAKRKRLSLTAKKVKKEQGEEENASSRSRLNDTFKLTNSAGGSSGSAAKLLVRRALTPKRLSSKGPKTMLKKETKEAKDDEPEVETEENARPDCKVM